MTGEQSIGQPRAVNKPGPAFLGPALAGAALWTWLLGMFFFGPLLYAVYRDAANTVGFAFAAGHILGLLVFSRDRLRRRYSVWLLWTLLPLTLASLLHPPLLAAVFLAVLAGFAAGGVVLWWVGTLRTAMRLGVALAVAVGLANTAVWLIGLASPWTQRWVGGGLILLCIALAARAFPPEGPDIAARPQATPKRAWLPPAHLTWFALGAYAAGGALYALLAPLSTRRPLLLWIGAWPYIIAFVAATCCTRDASLARLQAWSLSAIGLSAVLLAATAVLPWDFPLSWLLVMAGLGIADAFYWRSVVALSGQRGMLATAVALAWNVLVVAGTSLAMEFATLPVAGVVIALLLFLLAPRIMFFATRLHAEPPASLTRSEQQVLGLLLQGMTDAEIAARLGVSRNTVKFHVRNVLRKTGHPNRRDLRGSGMLAPRS